METRNRLRAIAERGAQTQEDKQFIKETAAALGVEFTPRPRCKNCYADTALILWRKLAENEQQDDGREWVLRPRVDILFSGVRVNEATLTDERAAHLVALGLPLSFFAKYPADVCK